MKEFDLPPNLYVHVERDDGLDPVFFPKIDLPSDVADWCAETLKGGYRCEAHNFAGTGTFTFPRKIIFEGEADAILFKLMWLDR